MSNGSPPARRRPTSTTNTGAGSTGQRPAVRKTAAAPAPVLVTGTKLMVSAGPHAGEEFALEDGEYVIGRSNDNAICIPDTSVSRKHVLVRRVGGGWAASDLGSGNGTLLNGEPVTDEMPLSHGDVLTLGDTEVTFQDNSNATMMMPMPSAPPSRPGRTGSRPAAAAAAAASDEGGEAVPRRPPPRPESRVRPGRGRGGAAAPDPQAQKRKKRLLLLTTAVFVMLVGLLVVIKSKQQQEAEAKAIAARAVQQQRAQLAGLFQDAKNLIREGKWKDAKEKLLELQALDPQYQQLADYLARVEKEIPNQDAIDEAKAALEKNQLGAATIAVNKVQADTQLFEQVRTLKLSLNEKADKRVLEAHAMMDQKQLDEAKAVIDDVLSAMPEHRDGKIIAEQVVAAITERDRPKPQAPRPEAPKPWDQAVERFRDGDLQGAVAIANSCVKSPQCKALMSQMTDFGNLYKRLEDLDAKGLGRLLDLDRKITNGRGSKLARNAGTRASTIFFKTASSAKASGQYGRAMENAQRALQADPSNVGAGNIVNELRQKAKELYLQAYTIRESSPEDALPKFREVLAMTTPDDETYQKAKSWIEKMQR
ncbi:MAG TPA: FHA domain-containing protein [Archangium sp.]|uniref:FHA domain-containing protein n=1 Tax=Archangium sp. TaxID=1872627 RepID=UPI002ED773B6